MAVDLRDVELVAGEQQREVVAIGRAGQAERRDAGVGAVEEHPRAGRGRCDRELVAGSRGWAGRRRDRDAAGVGRGAGVAGAGLASEVTAATWVASAGAAASAGAVATWASAGPAAGCGRSGWLVITGGPAGGEMTRA